MEKLEEAIAWIKANKKKAIVIAFAVIILFALANGAAAEQGKRDPGNYIIERIEDDGHRAVVFIDREEAGVCFDEDGLVEYARANFDAASTMDAGPAFRFFFFERSADGYSEVFVVEREQPNAQACLFAFSMPSAGEPA